MVEILKRKLKVDEKFDHRQMQVSYNSFGHLMMRFFDKEKPNEDSIIVFTQMETNRIIQFIKDRLR